MFQIVRWQSYNFWKSASILFLQSTGWPRAFPGLGCSPMSLWVMDLHGTQQHLWAKLTHIESTSSFICFSLLLMLLRRQFSTRQTFLTTCWIPPLKKKKTYWGTIGIHLSQLFKMWSLLLTSVWVLAEFQCIFFLIMDHNLLLLCMPSNL